MSKKTKISPIFLGIALMLMVSFIWVMIKVFDFDSHGPFKKEVLTDFRGIDRPLESQAGMYYGLKEGNKYPETKNNPNSKRDLDSFYKNRAYLGAPPTIPHQIKTSMNGSFENCLHCHLNGGFAAEFEAYAPVTPHPEFTNCKQCHVPQRTTSLFKDINWHKPTTAKLGKSHLKGSPPTIPHSLQMRETCLSCHSGQGSIKAIRVTHPERVNCLQCHVSALEETPWERGQL